MNIVSFWNRGIQASGVNQKIQFERDRWVSEAVALTRKQWLDSLLIDQTRAWMGLGESQREVLSGLCVVLTLAGLAKAFDDKSHESKEIRVIRGAISAAEQCATYADCKVSAADATAFSAAAVMAEWIIRECSEKAVIHASEHLSNYAKGM